MDWLIAAGGLVFIGIGILARVRSDLLWRLYSLEPRWRKDHPEKPDNWGTTATNHSVYLIGFGMIFVVIAIMVIQMAAPSA